MMTIVSFNKKTKTFTGIDVSSQFLKRSTIKESNILRTHQKRSGSVYKQNHAISKMNSSFLYIFKVDDNTFKFGCTNKILQRQKQIRTTSAMAELMAVRQIPKEKASKWKQYEKNFLSRFQKYQCANGGKEVFKMPISIAKNAAHQLREFKF